MLKVRRMWTILHNFLHRNCVPVVPMRYKSINYYSGPENPIAKIREQYLQITGGSVDLIKNEDMGIATLCLNQPERRNAISGKMMVDLTDAIATLESWSTGKGLIVYGCGQHFCSGGDLKMASMLSNPDDGFRMAVFMQKVLDQLENLPLISVALIEGIGAIGGGAEIAIACDFRLFTSDTRGIGFLQSRVGITPAWGGCTRLVHTIGCTKALDLLATGSMVSGKEALQMGLANGIVDSKNALTEATEWLKVRIKADAGVLKTLKIMTQNVKEMNKQKSLAEEKRLFAPLWGGPAHLTALTKYCKHT